MEFGHCASAFDADATYDAQQADHTQQSADDNWISLKAQGLCCGREPPAPGLAWALLIIGSVVRRGCHPVRGLR